VDTRKRKLQSCINSDLSGNGVEDIGAGRPGLGKAWDLGINTDLACYDLAVYPAGNLFMAGCTNYRYTDDALVLSYKSGGNLA
jgi:hypothetical protein